MYQLHADIFRKIELYVKLAKAFKDDLQEIKVRNEIEEHFGKIYCRVYVTLKLKAGSDKEYELYKAIKHVFYVDKEYFSFYLPGGYDRNENDQLLRNIEENTHYDYIWNLLSWHLESDRIKVTEENFQSQLDLKRKRLEQIKKREQESNRIEEAVESLSLETGQLIAIKQWYGSALRIGVAEKVVLPGKRQSFSIDLLEIKKDLTAGKVKIHLWSKSDIYAVLQSSELPKGISKADLLTSIERGENIRGLIWRRPNELWR